MGGNRFNGSLPGGWSSASLADLDLSGNALTGALPPGWGGAALPRLAMLHLQGNDLTGAGRAAVHACHVSSMRCLR